MSGEIPREVAAGDLPPDLADLVQRLAAAWRDEMDSVPDSTHWGVR